MSKNWFKSKATDTLSSGANPEDVRRPLLGPRDINPVRESSDAGRGQEARGPDIWTGTGEGTESKRLQAEANGLWKKIKGTDVTRWLVGELTSAFDKRYKRLILFAASQDNQQRIKDVLDYNKKGFIDGLSYLKELKDGSSENVFEVFADREARPRAVEFLKATADILESWEWRLNHANNLENKGRLDSKARKEVFNDISAKNIRAYLVVHYEVMQSIRVLYGKIEAYHASTDLERKMEQGIRIWMNRYYEYTKKFMLHFNKYTRRDNTGYAISTDDIENLRKAGKNLVGTEVSIAKVGIQKFYDYDPNKGKKNE